MTAPQILARSKIGSKAAYCVAALCLNNRGDAAGLKFGYAGEEKTDSSSCLSIFRLIFLDSDNTVYAWIKQR